MVEYSLPEIITGRCFANIHVCQTLFTTKIRKGLKKEKQLRERTLSVTEIRLKFKVQDSKLKNQKNRVVAIYPDSLEVYRKIEKKSRDSSGAPSFWKSDLIFRRTIGEYSENIPREYVLQSAAAKPRRYLENTLKGFSEARTKELTKT